VSVSKEQLGGLRAKVQAARACLTGAIGLIDFTIAEQRAGDCWTEIGLPAAVGSEDFRRAWERAYSRNRRPKRTIGCKLFAFLHTCRTFHLEVPPAFLSQAVILIERDGLTPCIRPVATQ